MLAMNGVGCWKAAATGVRFWLVAAADKTSRKKGGNREIERVRVRGTSQLHKQFMHNELYQWKVSSRFSVF